MNKYITLAALFLLMSVGKAAAYVNVSFTPKEMDSIHVSTNNMSSSALLANYVGGAQPAGTTFKGWVTGVRFSTGTCGDQIVLRDTNTANTSSSILATLYNVGGGTSPAVVPSGAQTCSGEQLLATPIPFVNGLSWNSNSATYNSLELFWIRKP